MGFKLRNVLLIALLMASLTYVHSTRQIQLILKFDEAINLQTTKFLQPTCESEEKIQQTLNQLDEWVQITQNMDSLKQYKQTLVDLVDMIEESRFYVEEKDVQKNTEETTNSVSELQMGNTNVEFTLDQLTERLSRIENIQTYLQTLREEGFQDYEDYGKVLTSLNSFIQEIDKLESMEDELSLNRFKLIEKADEISQIYNQCYAQKKQNFIEQESDSTNIFKLPLSEQTIKAQSPSLVKQNQSEDNDILKEELDSDIQIDLSKLDQNDILSQDLLQTQLLNSEIDMQQRMDELSNAVKDDEIENSIMQQQDLQETLNEEMPISEPKDVQDDSVFLQTTQKQPNFHKLKKSKLSKLRSDIN